MKKIILLLALFVYTINKAFGGCYDGTIAVVAGNAVNCGVATVTLGWDCHPNCASNYQASEYEYSIDGGSTWLSVPNKVNNSSLDGFITVKSITVDKTTRSCPGDYTNDYQISINKTGNNINPSHSILFRGRDWYSGHSVSTSDNNVSVTVHDGVAALTGTNTVCQGGKTTISGAATGGTWSSNNTNVAQVDGSGTVTGVGAGGCGIYLTSQDGCSAGIWYTVNGLPTATASNNNPTICGSGSATLVGGPSGMQSYNWSGSITSTSQNPSVSVSNTSDFYLTVKDFNSCSSTNTAKTTVSVYDKPVVVFTSTQTSVCAGDNVTMSVQNNPLYSYTWTRPWLGGSDNPLIGTSNSVTVSPNVQTQYSVMVSNDECSASATRTITINPLPNATVSASPSTDVCVNGTVTLIGSASGGSLNNYSYKWSGTSEQYLTNENDLTVVSIINFNSGVASNNNQVIFKVTDGNGCTKSTATYINVLGLPSIDLNSKSSAVCFNANSTQVSTLPFTNPTNSPTQYSIIWDGTATTNGLVNVGYSSLAGSSISVPVAKGVPSGSYNGAVFVKNGNGCISSGKGFTLTVNSLPTPKITVLENGGLTSNDGYICSGDNITLTATPASSYSWGNSSSAQSITVAPTANTTYNVTVTDDNGCQGNTGQLVTVYSLPNAYLSALPSTSVCANSAINYTGTAGGGNSNGAKGYSFTWGGNSVQYLGQQNDKLPTSTIQFQSDVPANTHQINFTVTDGNGCSKMVVSDITVYGLPSINASQKASGVCYNVNGTGNSSLSYTNPTNNPTQYSIVWDAIAVNYGMVNLGYINIVTTSLPIVVAKAVPVGTYNGTVYVKNGNGCISVGNSFTLTVNALPIPAISIAENSGMYPNDGYICSGDNITLTATTASSYSWGNSATTQSITISPTVNTTYNVSIVDGNGCQGGVGQLVTVNSSPKITLSALPTTSVCANTLISLTGTASGGNIGSGYKFTWDGAKPQFLGQQGDALKISTNTYKSNIASNSDYVSLQVSDQNNCIGFASSPIIIYGLPTANIMVNETSGQYPNDGYVCSGDAITLTASGGGKYQWLGNLGTSQAIMVNPTVNTMYTVIATDGNNCKDTANSEVQINELPTPLISVIENSGNKANEGVICIGDKVILSCKGNYSYQWDNNLGAGALKTVAPQTTTTYKVKATDNNNCLVQVPQVITVNTLPNIVLSPNVNTICANSPFNYTSVAANGSGDNYVFSWSGTGSGYLTDILQNGSSSTSLFQTIGGISGKFNVIVKVTDGNNCFNNDTSNVTVLALPVFTLSVKDNSGSRNDDGTICYGDNVTITTNGSNGLIYLWDNGLGNGSSKTVSPYVTTTYKVIATDINNCSNSNDQIITVHNPLVAGKLANQGQVCNNDPFEIKLNQYPTGGVGTWTWAWQYSEDGSKYNLIGNENNPTLIAGYLKVSRWYKLTSTNLCGSVTTAPSLIDVAKPLSPGIVYFDNSTVGTSVIVCSGNSNKIGMITGIPSTGGIGKSHVQWMVSNDSVNYIITSKNDTTESYKPTVINKKTFFYKTVNNQCGSVSTSPLRYDVYNKLNGGQIDTAKTLCFGQSTLIASVKDAFGGSGGLKYTWYSTGNPNLYAGSEGWGNVVCNQGSYITPNLKKSINYVRQATDTVCAVSVYTQKSIVNVKDTLDGGIISGNQITCANRTILPISSVNGATGGYGTGHYKWKKSYNISAKVGDNNWVEISNSDSLQYSRAENKSALYVRAKGDNCGEANSNVAYKNILPALSSGSIALQDKTPTCYGAEARPIISLINGSGGKGNGYYKWFKSNGNIPVNPNSWVLFDTTLIGSYNYGKIKDTVYVFRQFNDSVCGFENSVAVQLAVRKQNEGGRIGINQILCYGAIGDTIKSKQSGLGGTNNPFYTWSKSTSLGATIGDTSWRTISGANNEYYKDGQVFRTTSYVRNATDMCDTTYSNIVTSFVKNKLDGGLLSQSDTICYHSDGKKIHSLKNANGGYEAMNYQWFRTTDNSLLAGSDGWYQIPNATDSTLSVGILDISTFYVRKGTEFCGVVYTPKVSIPVFDSLNGGEITKGGYVCNNQQGRSIYSIKSPSGGKGKYTISWLETENIYVQPGDGNWSKINGNDMFYSLGALTLTKQYVRKVNDVCNESYSNPSVYIVKPPLNGGLISLTDKNNICNGYTAPKIVSNKPASGGMNNPRYKWYVNENNVEAFDSTWISKDSTGISLQDGKLTASQSYIRAASDSVCTYQVFSNPVRVVVNETLSGGEIGGDKIICSYADGGRIINKKPAYGGSGKYLYSFQMATDSSATIGGNLFSDVPLSGDTGLNVGTLNKSSIYVRKVTDGVCKEPVYTNLVNIGVKNLYNPGIINGQQSVCFHNIPNLITGSDNVYSDARFSWQTIKDGNIWKSFGNEHGKDLQLKNLDTSIYVRRVLETERCGNVYTKEVRINVYPLLDSVMLNLKQRYCRGENIRLNVSVPNGVNTVWDYQGNLLKNQNLDIIAIKNTQRLSVYNEDTNKCRSNVKNYVLAVDSVMAYFEYNVNYTDVGNPVDFINKSVGGQQYKWIFCDNCEAIEEKNPTFYFNQMGNYTPKLYVWSKYGCADTMASAGGINIIDKKLIDGVRDIEANDYVLIYPNPVKTKLNIECATKYDGEYLVISNVTGLTIYKEIIKGQIITLDMGLYQGGIYLLSIGNKQYKIVKL